MLMLKKKIFYLYVINQINFLTKNIIGICDVTSRIYQMCEKSLHTKSLYKQVDAEIYPVCLANEQIT